MQVRPLAAVLATAALIAAGCGDDATDGQAGNGAGGGQTAPQNGERAPEGTITVEGEELQFRGRSEVSGDGPTEVQAGNFFFEPTVLVGEPGQTVQVRVANDSDVAHTFTLQDQDVDEVLQSGQSATASVTMPDSGQLVFVCRFHIPQGMLGALDVPGGDDPGAQGNGGQQQGDQQNGEQGQGDGIY